MSDPANIRNLEQLQEDDDDRKTPRGVTAALLVLGGGCVVFAGLALAGRSSQTPTAKADPLGDLLNRRPHAAASASGMNAKPTEISAKDVTFPEMLSDEGKPATALVAVQNVPLAATVTGAPGAKPATPPTQPPPPTDRLPVVPLPAQAVLEATPVVTRPRDTLTKAATDAAQMLTPGPTTGDTAPAGHEGGYQLQVSSFRSQGEAQAFADQLRARGHKAHVVEAHVPARGTWYRVRIGPFATQHTASQYRSGFEAREHVVPFVVPPESSAIPH
ncbi:MAG: SPOR domain-containing protein [Polyangiaceae bacterium]